MTRALAFGGPLDGQRCGHRRDPDEHVLLTLDPEPPTARRFDLSEPVQLPPVVSYHLRRVVWPFRRHAELADVDPEVTSVHHDLLTGHTDLVFNLWTLADDSEAERRVLAGLRLVYLLAGGWSHDS